MTTELARADGGDELMVDVPAVQRLAAGTMSRVLTQFDQVATPFLATAGGDAVRLRDPGSTITQIDGLRTMVGDLRTRYGPALPADALLRLDVAAASLGTWRGMAAGAGSDVGSYERASNNAVNGRVGLAQALASAMAIDEAGGTTRVLAAGGLHAIDGASTLIGDELVRDAVDRLDVADRHLAVGYEKIASFFRTNSAKRSATAHASLAQYHLDTGHQLLSGLRDATGKSGDTTVAREMWSARSTPWSLRESARHRTSLFGKREISAVAAGRNELKSQRNWIVGIANEEHVTAAASWLRGNLAGRAEQLAATRAASDLTKPAGVHATELALAEAVHAVDGVSTVPDYTLTRQRLQALQPLLQEVADTAHALQRAPGYELMPESHVAGINALARRADHALEAAGTSGNVASADEAKIVDAGQADQLEAAFRSFAPDSPVSRESHPHEFALRDFEKQARDLAVQPIDASNPTDALYGLAGTLEDAAAALDARSAGRLGSAHAKLRYQAATDQVAARLRAIAAATDQSAPLAAVTASATAARLTDLERGLPVSSGNAIRGVSKDVVYLADNFGDLREVGTQLNQLAHRAPLPAPTDIASAGATAAAFIGDVAATESALQTARKPLMYTEQAGLRRVVHEQAANVLRARLAPLHDGLDAMIADLPVRQRQGVRMAMRAVDSGISVVASGEGGYADSAYTFSLDAAARRLETTLATAAKAAARPVPAPADAAASLVGTVARLDATNEAAADYRRIATSLPEWQAEIDDLDTAYRAIGDLLPESMRAPMVARLDEFALQVEAAAASLRPGAEPGREISEGAFPKLALASRIGGDAHLAHDLFGSLAELRDPATI